MNSDHFIIKYFNDLPWKNGGGLTSELYRSPPDGDFDYRLSMATIQSAGPFSSFAGYERIILPVSGARLNLNVSGQMVLLGIGDIFRFDGALSVHCDLVGGSSARDFNVIVNKLWGKAECAWIGLSSDDSMELRGSCNFIYVLEGAARLVWARDSKKSIQIKEGELIGFHGLKAVNVYLKSESLKLIRTEIFQI